MSMLKKIVFFVILVSLVSLTIHPSKGYCEDDWVYVESNETFTDYYNSSSIKIDKKNLTAEVWVKRVFTEKGKTEFLRNCNIIKKIKYNDIEYTLNLVLCDYKKWKWCITHLTYYSKSGNVLFDDKRPPNWMDIESTSIISALMDKLRKNYKIYIDSP